jgi:peroxisomal enoyl-CoA hydratase 2
MRRRAPDSHRDFLKSVDYLLLVANIDWSRGVDGERYIEVIKPIPTTSQGKAFELRRETVGAYDKGKAGLVLEEQTLLVDANTGEVYTKLIGSAFFVGQVRC